MFQITIPVSDSPRFEDRQVTEDMSLVQKATATYRRDANERIPTPDRDAILLLSANFSRHRLRTGQQHLGDLSRRVREQEVSDMSGNISQKCTLTQDKTVTSIVTTGEHRRQWYPDEGAAFVKLRPLTILPTPAPTATATQSQHRGKCLAQPQLEGPSLRPPLMRNAGRYKPRSPLLTLPRMPNVPLTLDAATKRHLLERVRIGGSVQAEMYRERKPDLLSPLVLPTLGGRGDAVEEYVKSRSLALQPQEKRARRRPVLLNAFSSASLRLHSPRRRRTPHGKLPTAMSDNGVPLRELPDTPSNVPMTAPNAHVDFRGLDE